MNLLTQNYTLKPCVLDHIPLILEMFREPDSNKYIQPLRDGSEDFWLEKLTSNIKKNDDFLQYWCVFDNESGDFVGTLNLNEFSNTGMEQLGVHLSRKYWGKGVGYEVCQAVMDYAWNIRKLQELHWIIEVEHQVSGKLAEKLGFKPFKEMDEDGCELLIYKQNRPD